MTPETIESKIKQGLEKINNEKTKSIKELNDLKATLSSQLTDTTEILNQSLRGVGEGEQRILKTNYQNRIKDLNTGVKDAKARIAEKEKSYIASITSSAKEIETKSNSTEKRLKTLLTTVDSKIEILNKDLSDLTTVESKIESLHEEIKTLKKNTEISISESVKKVETSLALHFDNSNPVNLFIKERLINELNMAVVEKDQSDWHSDTGTITRKDLVAVNSILFMNKTNIGGATPPDVLPKQLYVLRDVLSNQHSKACCSALSSCTSFAAVLMLARANNYICNLF